MRIRQCCVLHVETQAAGFVQRFLGYSLLFLRYGFMRLFYFHNLRSAKYNCGPEGFLWGYL